MKARGQKPWRLLAMAAVVCAAVWCAGCGERSVVLVPVAPAPVAVSLDEIVGMAKAGESDWAIIWAVRQSRRAWPLTTADIARLREAGASDRVVDFMLETVTAVRFYEAVPMTVEEVVGLAAAGVSDDDVIAEIGWTGTVFHLQAADVAALREQGVSDEVIDFMLYTRQLERPEQTWTILPEPR
jgi:hypothetical protein